MQKRSLSWYTPVSKRSEIYFIIYLVHIALDSVTSQCYEYERTTLSSKST